MAGSRQPPIHWPFSSPLPVAWAVCTLAGRPGRVRSQASVAAALVPRRFSSPLPLVALRAPCSWALRPGAVKASWPWPLRSKGWATSLPVSAASLVRSCRADSVRVPPASAGFHAPLALASRRCRPRLVLPGLPVDLSLTSNPMASPTLCRAAAPLSGLGARVVCKRAGLTPCSVDCRDQPGAGAVEGVEGTADGAVGGAAVDQRPVATTSPPPSCALKACSRPTPFCHCPAASRLSSGRRCWSQGPLRRLVSWTRAAQN